jgi:hypothetical protein
MVLAMHIQIIKIAKMLSSINIFLIFFLEKRKEKGEHHQT